MSINLLSFQTKPTFCCYRQTKPFNIKLAAFENILGKIQDVSKLTSVFFSISFFYHFREIVFICDSIKVVICIYFLPRKKICNYQNNNKSWTTL